MTKDDILKALSNVQEPDLGKDLVTLNMVKDIEIEGNYVAFTVVLTTPACPLKEMIKNACINAVKILVNKDATVQVRFTSNTTTKRKEGDVGTTRCKKYNCSCKWKRRCGQKYRCGKPGACTCTGWRKSGFVGCRYLWTQRTHYVWC